MSKIAILIPTLKSGGAEKQAALLAASLSESYDVHLITFSSIERDSAANRKILPTNIKRVEITGNFIKQTILLKNYLQDAQIEVMFNYLTKPNVLGCIVAKLVGVKRVYNGIRNSRLPFVKRVFEQIVHNFCATASIYNCYSGEEYFSRKGFIQDKSIVIPNCFPNIAAPIMRKDKEIKRIVTVGRFVPQKDYKTIIRTISELSKLRKDFMMDIIGYGDEEQNIRCWINEYGVEDYIKLYISPNNVQDIVRAADMYLSTSLFEGTSNSIMEALNWSLPVVATNVGDNNHLVVDGINGMIHAIGDAKGMAESLAAMIDNYDLRISYGLAGNKILRDNYSMEIFEKRYIKLIES